MKIEAFDITFDNPEGVYFAGEEVKGEAVLSLSEDATINELLLELKGGAKTYWTKHSGKSRKHFRDSENYFCEQFNTKYTWAFGKSNERVIPKGRHAIPFAFILPENAPSSFEGEYGHIRYTCKATLERPWDSDVLCKRAFTVIGLDDLNDHEEETKRTSTKSTTFASMSKFACCRSLGTVSVRLFLPKTAFVPGENICKQFSLSVKNVSRKCIKSIGLKIDQSITYTAKDFEESTESRKQTRRIVNEEKHLRIEPGEEFVSTSDGDLDFVNVVLPPVVSNLTNSCRIIKINYELLIDVDSNRSVLSMPLIVGAVPLLPKDSDVKDFPSKSVTFKLNDKNMVSGNEIRKILVSSAVEYRPNFRDSVFGPVDITDEKETVQYGQLNFVTKYPCYNL